MLDYSGQVSRMVRKTNVVKSLNSSISRIAQFHTKKKSSCLEFFLELTAGPLSYVIPLITRMGIEGEENNYDKNNHL